MTVKQINPAGVAASRRKTVSYDPHHDPMASQEGVDAAEIGAAHRG